MDATVTAEAALAFLDALDERQRAAACFPFPDEPQRRDWHYVPRSRAGVHLGDLDADQARLARRLVASGLSRRGQAQVAAVVALEDVLDWLEGGRRGRHSRDYSVTVFGDPGTPGGWAWRFEGHHVSVNTTVVDGRVATTPNFLGANPARVPGASAPLADDEDLARRLVLALPDAQRRRAVISPHAPADILTANAPRLGHEIVPEGLAAAELASADRRLLDDLVGCYVGRVPDGRGPDVDGLHLAWAGGLEPGQPHYYRLQGESFLVEYDNTQDGANHVHTVWRDRDSDFGDDLLRAHRAGHHADGDRLRRSRAGGRLAPATPAQ